MHLLRDSVLVFSYLVALALVPSPASAQTACHLLDSSRAIPAGFGAAYNLLSSQKEVISSVHCGPGSKASLAVGNGQSSLYIYKTAYEWTGSNWRELALSGQNRSGSWYIGSAAANLVRSEAQLAQDNFVVTWTCLRDGNQWKCGCRNTTCTTNYWQLQAFRYVPPTDPDREFRPISEYEASYNKLRSDNLSSLNKFMSTGGDVDANGYYRGQYALQGAISLYEATGNTVYLEHALDWGERMVDAATINSVNPSGYKLWPGDSTMAKTPNVSHYLGQVQGTTELARMARIVLNNPTLETTYGTQATKIFNHVRKNFAELHFDLGSVHTFVGSGGQYDICVLSNGMSDKALMAARVLNDLYMIDGTQKYLDKVVQTIQCLDARFVDFPGGGIILEGGFNGFDYLDVGHANRIPELLVALHETNAPVLGLEYVTGTATLLAETIWNGSTTDPLFANFMDGSDHPDPDAHHPIVSRGWAQLSGYNYDAYRAMDALYSVLGTGTTIANRHSEIYTRLALFGNLAKGVAMKSAGVRTPWM